MLYDRLLYAATALALLAVAVFDQTFAANLLRAFGGSLPVHLWEGGWAGRRCLEQGMALAWPYVDLFGRQAAHPPPPRSSLYGLRWGLPYAAKWPLFHRAFAGAFSQERQISQ